MPELIDPPDSSPLISDDPVDSAVAVAERDGIVQVLGVDGRWRTVPVDADHPSATISPDGTRVSLTYYGEHSRGAIVYDVASGASRTVSFPDDYRPLDDTQWIFVDEDRLLLSAGERAWVVELESGSAERLPEGLGGGLSTAVDPAGGIVVSADWSGPNVLTDYSEGMPRKVTMDQTGRLSAMGADAETIVGTSYDGRPFAVVVADRASLTPEVLLPVRDFDGYYSNGGLGTVALTDDGVVLLRVATFGRGGTGFRVVAWDPDTGDLSVVSRADEPLVVDFAEKYLRESGG